MSFSKGSIFRARQSGSASVSRAASPANVTVTDSTVSVFDNNTSKNKVLELTKNDKYCVSKLPALPSVFNENNGEAVFNGYSDHLSNYSLVVASGSIYVWNYKSIDTTPLLFQFPLDKDSLDSKLPLAILTNPSTGNSQDPGLVIINATTGDVKFYESVQHAPALGIINNKQLESNIPIQSRHGEYITLAENVEPAGIMVATSWKRVVLVTIRDFQSKPHLSTHELLSPSKSTSMFSGFFSSKPSETKVNDEIVSLKSGKISNNGLTQDLIIQDSVGRFYKFTFQSLSVNGAAYLDPKKSVNHALATYLENNLDGFIPGSSLNIKFLDLWPLQLPEKDDIYVALLLVGDEFKNEQDKNLFLITMKIDSSGALLHGSHRLSTFDPQVLISLVNKPRLYIPSPGTSAFVFIEDLIIVTDINLSYISSHTADQYYSPRWEDTIKLKHSVDVIGQGYENPSSNSNPSLILLTKNSGVLRIERFIEPENSMEVDGKNLNDPLKILKSHIEQGIFYNDYGVIDFDIQESYPENILINSIDQIGSEILNNTSPYLPAFLPSIKDFLNLKLRFFHGLVDYSKRNFPGTWPKIASNIVRSLEMTDVSLNLWEHLSSETSKDYREILQKVIIETNAVEGLNPNEDILRKFFSQGTKEINQVLTRLVENLIKDHTFHDELIKLLVKTCYNGIFINEEKLIVGHDKIPTRKLWIFDTELLVRIDEIFCHIYCGGDDSILTTSESRTNLIKLTEVLYFLFNNAIQFMQTSDPSNGQFGEYVTWYKTQRDKWMQALMSQDLNKDAVRISEKYYDFSSLAKILEAERLKVADETGTEGLEYKVAIKTYESYFEKYGYMFARSLYDYYLKNDLIQDLLLSFNNYHPYLKQYFKESPKKTEEVSWIRSLIDEEYGNAAVSIIDSADSKVDDYQDNRQLKYSIGKLAAIAAEKSPQDFDSNQLIDYKSKAEKNLQQGAIQNRLFDKVSKFFEGNGNHLTLDLIANSHFNSEIDLSTSKKIVGPFFDKFVNSKPLSMDELINLLTLIKPNFNYQNGFSDALEVALLLPDPDSYSYYCQLIWLRLLTTTDDWSFLKATQGNSDDENKRLIHDTTLYHTLAQLGSEHPTLRQLDVLLKSQCASLVADELDDTINSLTEQLKRELETSLSDNNLASWIEAIVVEIKTFTSL